MYVIDTPKQSSLAVQGSEDRFPVRRVFCVGRNYEAHVLEMGNDMRDPPFFFTKPADATRDTPCTVPYPPLTEDFHFEIELVIAIGKGGANIEEADVMDHIWGASAGIDFTRRDLQAQAKKMGRPWEIGKAFERSAPCGPVHPASDVGHPDQGRVSLTVNGDLRQDGDLNQMIWKVPEMIAYLSEYFELAAGDVILSGTPAGVAAIERGDVMEMAVDGLGSMAVTVV